MGDDSDYLACLQRLGLIHLDSASFFEERRNRLMQIAHARAWLIACLPDHAPQEWQLFIDTWRMLPEDAGLPYLTLKSWLRRWHSDVRWMERWMISAAWAIRRGDDRGGVPHCSELVARELGHSLRISPYINLSDHGRWREELEDEQGPEPGRESEKEFLARMKRAYTRRRQRAQLPRPGTIFDRDAGWFVRYQIAGENLSAMPDVGSGRHRRRSIDVVLMEFAMLIGLEPRGPLPRAFQRT